MEAPIGRTMPYSAEAEQAILGSMIVSQSALTKAMEQLRTDDFYLEQHKAIYEALLYLFTENMPVDLVTLCDALKDKLEMAGGVSYLAHIANSVGTTENIKYYIDIVKNKAIVRRLIEAATDIAQMGYEEKEEVSVILDSAEQKIFSILQNRGLKEFYHIRDLLPHIIQNIEKLRQTGGKMVGLPTGFARLDAITSGLQNSDLLILAARPGIGKTSFALNIAKNVANRAGVPVAIFSFEMSKEQLVNRILWSEAMVDGERLRTGNLTMEDMRSISRALGNLIKAPIYIDDTTDLSVSEMRAKCRRLKLEKNLGMVVIDYLQLMQGSGRRENRQQEISEISRSLKIMAKELDIPVLALSQLSRATETREKPILSDLRESGAIEQDADIVMFLSRKSGDDVSPEDRNVAECIIAKHRNGPTGSIKLVWRGEYTRFMDYEGE